MQFKNIVRVLVCFSLALVAQSASAQVASTSGRANFGKLLSSYTVSSGVLSLTVEDTSRTDWIDVIALVQCLQTGPNSCPSAQVWSFGTLFGGQKMSFPFSAPRGNAYLITINGFFNSAGTPINYPIFLAP